MTVNAFRSKEECSDYKGPFLPKKAGMNRFLWNMRHADAETVPWRRDRGRPGRERERANGGSRKL